MSASSKQSASKRKLDMGDYDPVHGTIIIHDDDDDDDDTKEVIEDGAVRSKSTASLRVVSRKSKRASSSTTLTSPIAKRSRSSRMAGFLSPAVSTRLAGIGNLTATTTSVTSSAIQVSSAALVTPETATTTIADLPPTTTTTRGNEYIPSYIHKNVEYYRAGSAIVPESRRRAYELIVQNFEIPADLEQSRWFGPLSGSSYEDRVIQAYTLGKLPLKNEDSCHSYNDQQLLTMMGVHHRQHRNHSHHRQAQQQNPPVRRSQSDNALSSLLGSSLPLHGSTDNNNLHRLHHHHHHHTSAGASTTSAQVLPIQICTVCSSLGHTRMDCPTLI